VKFSIQNTIDNPFTERAKKWTSKGFPIVGLRKEVFFLPNASLLPDETSMPAFVYFLSPSKISLGIIGESFGSGIMTSLSAGDTTKIDIVLISQFAGADKMTGVCIFPRRRARAFTKRRSKTKQCHLITISKDIMSKKVTVLTTLNVFTDRVGRRHLHHSPSPS